MTEQSSTETPKASAIKTPKEQKTSTVTLHAGDATLQIVAERWKDAARTYVITTGGDKKSSRGMTELHPTFEVAKAHIAKLAHKAEKSGWTRRVAGRVFQPKKDEFSTLPAAPKGGKK